MRRVYEYTPVIAAADLPRAARDGFLREVASRLSASPTDDEVEQAVAEAIQR
jgi:hypothetical protein